MNRVAASMAGGFLLSLALPLFLAVFGPFTLQGNLVLAVLVALPTWIAAIIWGMLHAPVVKTWLWLLGSSAFLASLAIVKIAFWGIEGIAA